MNRAPTLRSPCGERVTNLGQHAVLPLPKASLPRYSILSAFLANRSTRVASLVPSGPQDHVSSYLPPWPTNQRVN